MSYRDILYHWGIQPIFYSNYDWSITFKNCESLYFTPVTYIVLGTNYILQYSKDKDKKKKKPDPQTQETNLQLSKGKGEEGYIRSFGLTDTK